MATVSVPVILFLSFLLCLSHYMCPICFKHVFYFIFFGMPIFFATKIPKWCKKVPVSTELMVWLHIWLPFSSLLFHFISSSPSSNVPVSVPPLCWLHLQLKALFNPLYSCIPHNFVFDRYIEHFFAFCLKMSQGENSKTNLSDHTCRMILFSGSRKSQRCCSGPTPTTSTRPSSTMRLMTPSACWRRLWTWSPPLPNGFPSPGSTDKHNWAHHLVHHLWSWNPDFQTLESHISSESCFCR